MDSSFCEKKASKSIIPPRSDSPNDENNQFSKEYSKIQSRDQRAQYKADFNAQYQDYLRLHNYIQNVSEKFILLELQLYSCKEDSPEFMYIENKIYEEYRDHKYNPEYMESIKKLQLLHSKLSYIKKLIMEYDNAHSL